LVFQIREDRVPGVIGTLTATDVDAGDGNNLKYSISAGNAAGLFSLSSRVQGGKTVTELVLGPGDGPNAQLLDYETANGHILDLTVEDPGGLSTDFSVKLEIMDVNEKPAVDAVKEMVVPENAYYTDDTGKSVYHLGKETGMNHLVGTLTATDPDGPITTFEFSMVKSGSTTGDNGAYPFTVSNDGKVRVSGNVVLDKESTASYTLCVRVRDGWRQVGKDPRLYSDTLCFPIRIADVNENPEINDAYV
jgi:hypothetical protein